MCFRKISKKKRNVFLKNQSKIEVSEQVQCSGENNNEETDNMEEIENMEVRENVKDTTNVRVIDGNFLLSELQILKKNDTKWSLSIK